MSDTLILSTHRKRAFDDPPQFDENERLALFMITPDVRRTIRNMNAVAKVAFILQRGYFQVKGRFFPLNKVKKRDKSWVEKNLGIKSPVDFSEYPASTNSHHRQKILDEYGWRPFRANEKEHTERHAFLLVDKQESKEEVLFALLAYCWRNKIEIPSYTQFADIIANSFAAFETGAVKNFEKHVTQRQTDLLTDIISGNEEFDAIGAYKVDQSDSMMSLRRNAESLCFFRRYHDTLKSVFQGVGLSNAADKHFSSWIYLAPKSQIKQLKNQGLLHLRTTCFVKDQYYLRNDYAFDAIRKVTRNYKNRAKKFEHAEVIRAEPETLEFTGKLMDYAKSAEAIIQVIYKINKDPELQAAEKNERTLQLIESYTIATGESVVTGFERLDSLNSDKKLRLDYFDQLNSCSRSIHLRLAEYVKHLEFDEEHSSKLLIDAINYFKRHDGIIGEDAPTTFLSKQELTAVYRAVLREKKLMVEEEDIEDADIEPNPAPDEQPVTSSSDDNILNKSLYRALLYLAIGDAISNSTLKLLYSYRYLATDHTMISKDEFRRNFDDYIEITGLQEFKDVEGVLKQLQSSIAKSYANVNANLINGNNPHLKFKNGIWHISTPKTDFDTTKFISTFLRDFKHVPLAQVIREIDNYTNFSEAFTNPYIKNAETSVSKNVLHAVITSIGCNLGHRRMSVACSEVSEQNLQHAEEWLFSNKNIKRANDRVVEVIQSLSLPTVFLADLDSIHTSSDGKKIVVAVNSLLANYSFKYYGREKGVVVNNFMDEKQSFFHVNVLTSSDREVYEMIDGISNNKIAAGKKHKHSSDSHGFTEAGFAMTHLFKISFAPRIKNSGKQALYTFSKKDLKKKNSSGIVPTAVITVKKIVDAWEDMLRLAASINLGRCSASVTLRQLAAAGDSDPLYRGLKEFGKLLKTKFLLEYYNDVDLRQKIQKQLNRVELGQKLQEAVFFGRKGKLYVGDDVSITKAFLCSTLIRNCIILWNYLVLSDALIEASPEEREQIIEGISGGSVLSWHHINMLGQYQFTGDIISRIKNKIEDILAFKI